MPAVCSMQFIISAQRVHCDRVIGVLPIRQITHTVTECVPFYCQPYRLYCFKQASLVAVFCGVAVRFSSVGTEGLLEFMACYSRCSTVISKVCNAGALVKQAMMLERE